ncbi:hypothetical protein [uncultured Cohaesibacter sp.]|uniref:hypothetical protein n=1 Tax=uncultured Cohaesibacter sp. TaxID=1002546 RepID=UPI0029C84300|nr:hypothetical protein [uncultured Cohaesibacter sp.]
MQSTLPPVHHDYLARVRDLVASDPRFDALLIGGSYLHGGLDDHSDLDFVVVVNESDYQNVMGSRHSFAEAAGPLLSAFTGEHVGEPRLLICLYGPPLLHVDFKFVLIADLDLQVEERLVLFARDPVAIRKRLETGTVEWPNLPSDWFEDRAWIWLHYATTKLARGELYEAIGMLGFFREQILGPLICRRAGRNQRGVRRLEMLDLDVLANLSSTVALHDRVSVTNALHAAIALYLDLRADDPSLIPTRDMPHLLNEILEQAAAR